MARPAASTPTGTGDICRRPSRRRVARTAQWWVARDCRASGRSMVGNVLSIALRCSVTLHRVWRRYRGTAGGGEIGRKLLSERPGSLVLRAETVSSGLGLGTQVHFIDCEHGPVFEHDAAIHQDCVYIGASFGVDEGVERVIERP